MRKQDLFYKNKLSVILAIIFFKKSKNPTLTIQKIDRLKSSLSYILK